MKNENSKNNLIKLLNLIGLFIGINLKAEYDIELLKKNKEIVKSLIVIGNSFFNPIFRPAIMGMEFQNLIKVINLDYLSFSFGIPKYKNGLAIIIKLPGISEYFKDLFK